MTLFAGLKVSTLGLKAQGTKMSAISDNIANVNTVGYKRTEVQFSTLVTERIRETRFTPGGVIARPRQTVDQEGQLLGTGISTDLAVSGRGMFIVSENPVYTTQTSDDGLAYTRAGSFRADQDGFLRNTAGYYLQGWTVNRNGDVTLDGTDPATIVNSPGFNELQPVNVNRFSNIAEQTENFRTRTNLPADAVVQSNLNGPQLLADGSAVANIENLQIDLAGTGGATPTFDQIATRRQGAETALLSTSADFNQVATVYDALGQSHQVTLNYYRYSTDAGGPNTWAVRIESSGVSGTKSSPPLNAGTLDAALAGADATTIQNAVVAAAQAAGVSAADTAIMTGAGGSLNGIAAGDAFSTRAAAVRAQLGGGAPALSTPYSEDTITAVVNALSTQYARFAEDDVLLDQDAALGGAVINDAAAEKGTSMEVPRFITYNGRDADGTTYGAGQVSQTQTLFLKFTGDGALQSVYTDPLLSDEGRVATATNDATSPLQLIQVAVGQVAIDPTGAAGTGANENLVIAAETPNDTTDSYVPSPFGTDGAKPLVFNFDVGRPTEVRTSSIGTATNSAFAGTGLDGYTHFDLDGPDPTLTTYFTSQDGLRAGVLTGVGVDDDGFMTAFFDNGAQRLIYRVPLVSFVNFNGLINESGNLYRESRESGAAQINATGVGYNGDIVGGALEQANVDLGDEFTDMIITQQGFTANTRAITTTDEMLTDINNMVR